MFIPLPAPRFELTECRSEAERRFLDRLHERAAAAKWQAESWSHVTDHLLIVVTCVRGNTVTRDLRVDFHGHCVYLPEDDTHQFVNEPDPRSHHVQVVRGSPAELADQAADWLDEQTQSRFPLRSLSRAFWKWLWRPDCDAWALVALSAVLLLAFGFVGSAQLQLPAVGYLAATTGGLLMLLALLLMARRVADRQ